MTLAARSRRATGRRTNPDDRHVKGLGIEATLYRLVPVVHSWSLMRNRPLIAALAVLLITIGAASAQAQSEDAVVVLFHGGVESVLALDLANAGVQELGHERIAQTQWSGLDFKRLPLRGHLLSQASGAGFAIFDSEAQPSFIFDEEFRFRSVPSASVAGYVALGEPGRILMADSFQGVVSIRDIKTDRLVWFENFQIQGSFPDFASAIVMPQNRVVIAANWPSLDLKAIDIFDFEGGEIQRRQIANRVVVGAPEDSIPVESFDEEIVDVFGLPDGDLLVSTTFSVMRMTDAGEVVWRFDTASDPTISGEVRAARLLPSGKFVVATFKRGRWVESDPDHRIHWLSGPPLERVASSSPLERAPAGLDLYQGHGGSGTFNYEAGFAENALGTLDAIELSQFSLSAEEFERGDNLQATASLRNTGDLDVILSEATISATPGTCDAPNGPSVELASASGITISASTTFVLMNEIVVSFDFDLGSWCARIEAQDLDGNQDSLATMEFGIVDEAQDRPSPVDVSDLEFDRPMTEADTDMGGDAGGQEISMDEGCGCGSTGASHGTPFVLLFILFALLRPLGRGRVLP